MQIVVVGPLTRGVVLPADGLVIVTEEEIFGTRVHRRRERSQTKDVTRPFLEDLRSLATGDYVVHAEHGIGRYQGLVHRHVSNLSVDLIAVEYAGGDKLYLPVWRLNLLEKYAGGESGQPKLDRLGGGTFAKTKARIGREVRKMADEASCASTRNAKLKCPAKLHRRRGRRVPHVRSDVPLRRDRRPGPRQRSTK